MMIQYLDCLILKQEMCNLMKNLQLVRS